MGREALRSDLLRSHPLPPMKPILVLLLGVTGFAAPAGAQPADTLTVVTLNIWHDQQDWPRRLGLILDTLGSERPDVICLQEVLQKEGLPNQATTLGDGLGYDVTFVSVDGSESPKRYGNAILSRHPILGTNETKLEPLDDYRVAAHARVDVAGRPLDVYCTHLHHTGEGGATRATQLRDLLGFIGATRDEAPGAVPLVLAGDFNAPPDAPELRLLADRFADAYATTHPDQVGVLVTTLNPALGHTPRRIDYLFYERDAALTPLDTRILFTTPAADSTWASDHFGVVGRFAWPH